ncbi:hypothetical protein F5X99DRAFT_375195 [Biscogniauxia marginata]|nr:hypothetical protein F5X99DRAFT_375195 [Biscogniauxia marginata]
MSEPLTRVDSGIEGLSTSPTSKSHPEPNIPEPIDRVDSGIADLSLQNKTQPQPKAPEPLDRVDSGIAGLSSSPPKDKAHRRASSSVNALPSAKDLWETKTEIQVAIETQKTGWKINKSSMTVDDRDILKKPLVTPHIKSIDLVYDSGIVTTVRSKKRNEPVTIKDALDAIHTKNKKKEDDELTHPYLAGFEWKPDHMEYTEAEEAEHKEDWGRLYIHLSSTPGVSNFGNKKKKNKVSE